ncbi:fibronectin type III domain-containing protein [Cryptosporidium felis]|nr:fibronectin type III domain-containing protein [Cryptosporidium felis]
MNFLYLHSWIGGVQARNTYKQKMVSETLLRLIVFLVVILKVFSDELRPNFSPFVLISTNFKNENSVFEIAKLENQFFKYKNSSVEFIWDRFQVNDAEGNFCYFYKHSVRKASDDYLGKDDYSLPEFSTDFVKLFSNSFSNTPLEEEKISKTFTYLSTNLLRFFDYEFDPSRPNEVSDIELKNWREARYDKMKLEELIVPGKGSGRLYVKIKLERAFIGTYFGFLRVKSEGSTEITRVELKVAPPPLELFLIREEFSSLQNNELFRHSLNLRLKNELAFHNLDVLISTEKGNLKNGVCRIKQLFGEYSRINKIKPGEYKDFEIECTINKEKKESIEELFLVKILSFWKKNSKKFMISYRYKDLLRYHDREFRGIYLTKDTQAYSIIEDEYYFSAMRRYLNRSEYLRDNEVGRISYTGKGEIEVFNTKAGIKLDLMEISKEILVLEDLELNILIENSPTLALSVYFCDSNEKNRKTLQFGGISHRNSLLYIELNLSLNESFFVKNRTKANKIDVPIRIELKSKDDFSERGTFEKEWIFTLKFQLNNQKSDFLVEGNILNYKEWPRLILSENDTLEFKITKISGFGSSEDSGNTSIGLYVLNEEIVTEEVRNNFRLISEIGSIQLVDFEEYNFKATLGGRVDSELIRQKQEISGEKSSVEVLPYFIGINEETKFQLGVIRSCGEIQVDNEELNFGIIPATIQKNLNLIRKVELKLKKTRTGCNSRIPLGFTLSKNYGLRIKYRNEGENRILPGNRFEDGETNTYFYKLEVENSGTYEILVEPDFKNQINVRENQTLDFSTTLEIYTPKTIIKNPNTKQVYLKRESWREISGTKLFLTELIKVACKVRGLNVRAGSPSLRIALHSEISSADLVGKGRLPVSLAFVEVKNEEEFPVLYSLQREVEPRRKGLFEDLVKNYAFYVSYEDEEQEGLNGMVDTLAEEYRVFRYEGFLDGYKGRGEVYDDLSFNFPFGKNFYRSSRVEISKGAVCLFGKEDFKEDYSFCVRMFPIEDIGDIGDLTVSMGHTRINRWEVNLVFFFKSEKVKVSSTLKLYESGRLNWSLRGIGGLLPLKVSVLRKLTPILVEKYDSRSRFELRSVVDTGRIRNSVSIFVVPWLEVSSEIPRSGFLLPKENRVIPILVHNQIMVSSSAKSKLRDLHCRYSLVVSGLPKIDLGLENFGFLGGEESFSRLLLESDLELQEEEGMKSSFPISWRVPNLLNQMGFGGGFVKKVVSIPHRIIRSGNSKKIWFVLEIQNPVICTERQTLGDSIEDFGSFESFNYQDTPGQFSGDRICSPYGNLDLVKGFRIIWYPFNNFSPTNYRSIEVQLSDVPKYDFKTNSYNFDATEENEAEENREVSLAFEYYLKNIQSKDSDFAYLVGVDCECTPGHEYTFKFAVTHHGEIKNSVFSPPFGFNITVQNYSFTQLRSLKELKEGTDFRDLAEKLSKKICKGEIEIFPNNTGILRWNSELLKFVKALSLDYFSVDNKKEQEEDWEVQEMDPGFKFEENSHGTLNQLILIKDFPGSEKGVSRFFLSQNSSESMLALDFLGLPSFLDLRFLVRMQDSNKEGFQCISKVFRTFSGAPTEPEKLQYSPLTLRSIKLSWEPPISDGGSEILEYNIKLTPELVESAIELGIKSISTSSKTRMVILDQVFPWVTYTVIVQARNKFGLGKASSIPHVMARAVGSSSKSLPYKLIIDENSRRELVWRLDKNNELDLESVFIYVYCNEKEREENGNNRENAFLVLLLKAGSLCREEKKGFLCLWRESGERLLSLRCESYFIKVFGSLDDRLIHFGDLLRKKHRRLKEGDRFEKDSKFVERFVEVKHLRSLQEWEGTGGTGFHFPEGYNPDWRNGLMRSVLEVKLSSRKVALVQIEVGYLFEKADIGSDLLFNGTSSNVWGEKFKYVILRGGRSKEQDGAKAWSIFEERDTVGASSEEIQRVRLAVLNLIPEMTVSLSVKEFDKEGAELAVSNHVLRVPNREKDGGLRERKLKALEVLEVYKSGHLETLDTGRLSGLRQLKGGTEAGKGGKEESVGLEIKLHQDCTEKRLSNSLFVASKMIIDGWPEDFERRVFERVDLAIHSGHLRFTNNSREIKGAAEGFLPVSELHIYNQSSFNRGISSLFDGNMSSSLDFYLLEDSESGEVTEAEGESFFPHINFSLTPPICVLYIKLFWKGGFSPVSTMVSLGLGSSGSSQKKRRRFYNPVVHDCASGNGTYAPDRVDTIQIIPPEELANTYLANPSKRYPRVTNITLSFAGSCKEPREEREGTSGRMVLSLGEIEIVPCITNDLALSLSDPLREKNNTLVNPKHLISRDRLEEKYQEIQRIVLNNLEKEAKNTPEAKAISVKYKRQANETRILLELQTVLSEEAQVKSMDIPSVRVLLQGRPVNGEPGMGHRAIRRLMEENSESEPGTQETLDSWLDIVIVGLWSALYAKKRLQ